VSSCFPDPDRNRGTKVALIILGENGHYECTLERGGGISSIPGTPILSVCGNKCLSKCRCVSQTSEYVYISLRRRFRKPRQMKPPLLTQAVQKKIWLDLAPTSDGTCGRRLKRPWQKDITALSTRIQRQEVAPPVRFRP
jgi:hypothetical protein